MADQGSPRYKILFVFGLFATFALSTGCPAKQKSQTDQDFVTAEAGDPVSGGMFHSAGIGDASTLLPPLAQDSASFGIISKVYSGLLKRDGNLNIIGDLAASWEVTEEGRRITFKLKPGILWHDGKPLTAEDVLHSFRILMDPSTPTAYASDYERVVDISAPTTDTVAVVYSEPFAPALDSWVSFRVIPKHLVPYAHNITLNALNRKPVGSGPFRFRKWLPQQVIELEAWDQYFDGRPYLDRYEHRIIPDQQTIFLELKAGKLDSASLTPLQWTRQTSDNDFKKKFDKYQSIGFSYTYLGFNMKRPPFDDKSVRQAISYAVNQEEIIEGVLMGQGLPAHSPWRPDMWYSNAKVKTYPFDPAKAKSLLAKAGYEDKNGDGVIERDGKPFRFEIVTNQGNQLRKQTAEILQRRLQEIGIDVNIRIIEWSAFLTKFVNPRNFDAVILGWGLSPEPDQYSIWHSSQTAATQFNFVGFDNSRVDELLIAGRRTVDQEKRAEMYREIQEILAEEVPYVWLYIPYSLEAVDKRIQGVELGSSGIGHNFERWWIPQNRRMGMMR